MYTPTYRPVTGDFPGREIREDHGYLEFRFGPAGTCEIVNIEVERPWRSKGIGATLLARLESFPEARVIYAFTAADNIRAQNFYRKNGFTLTPVPLLYAAVGRGAWICVKEVKHAAVRGS